MLGLPKQIGCRTVSTFTFVLAARHLALPYSKNSKYSRGSKFVKIPIKRHISKLETTLNIEIFLPLKCFKASKNICIKKPLDLNEQVTSVGINLFLRINFGAAIIFRCKFYRGSELVFQTQANISYI